MAEASLTGESEPCSRTPRRSPRRLALGDRLNMVFKGTAVTQGGAARSSRPPAWPPRWARSPRLLGRTAGASRRRCSGRSPAIGRMLGIAVIVIARRGRRRDPAAPPTSGPRPTSSTVLLLGVSLAVAAVPEGLPAILSVVLALGVQRMARAARDRQEALVGGDARLRLGDLLGQDRHADASEMTIERWSPRSGEVDVTGIGYRPEGELLVGGRAARRTRSCSTRSARVLSGGQPGRTTPSCARRTAPG